MNYTTEMIKTLYAALDIHVLDLDGKRCEIMIAHEAYTYRAMCETYVYKKNEKSQS